MSLGHAPTHVDLFRSSADFCRGRVSPTSIYELLHNESHALFPDEAFADLFSDIGRWSVPPRIVSVVMVLQRLEGLSDREAAERFSFDLRWKYAAGGLDFDFPGFVHTVLVDMRARLRRSKRPNRIFETSLEVARAAGLVGRKRVLDSTPLYDAVATQDTVTLIRWAIRGLLRVAEPKLAGEVRKVLRRDDEYANAGKPSCDWEDAHAREALVDALVRDAHEALRVVNGRDLSDEVKAAAALLATVTGQDIEQSETGVFRIARGVAPDRVLSTVDPESRHGHKTAARGFDGYKGHIAIDPDSEIVTATEVTAGNVGDARAVSALLPEVPLVAEESVIGSAPPEPPGGASAPIRESPSVADEAGCPNQPPIEVFGDSAYGTGEVLAQLQGHALPNLKLQPPVAPRGAFTKERFQVDLATNTVTCPAGQRAVIHPRPGGAGMANFGSRCATCLLRSQCTTSTDGRSIHIHPRESILAHERDRQKTPAWKLAYRATRPKVERKLAHLMRRRHGGRRARMRGRLRVSQDFSLLAAAANFARLAVLKVHLRPAEPASP
jgi:hypothetical protein